jgi:hypothetical protein
MATDEEPRPEDHARKVRMQDARVALVRIRHRLQKIQDEMDELNQRKLRDSQRKPKSKDR